MVPGANGHSPLGAWGLGLGTWGLGLGKAVAELDPEFTESKIMGVDLPGARSMRMLERIDVVRLPKR